MFRPLMWLSSVWWEEEYKYNKNAEWFRHILIIFVLCRDTLRRVCVRVVVCVKARDISCGNIYMLQPPSSDAAPRRHSPCWILPTFTQLRFICLEGNAILQSLNFQKNGMRLQSWLVCLPYVMGLNVVSVDLRGMWMDTYGNSVLTRGITSYGRYQLL